jgi:hypothetical protein
MPTEPVVDPARRVAGWYPDLDGAGGDAAGNAAVERWWNGTQWTTHTRTAGATMTDLAAVEGESPRAWSAGDEHLLATIDEPYRAAARQPDPLDVPPGWYPDPQGYPMLRWWDGWAWSAHTGPLPPPPGVLVPGKSVGVAIVLTLFFGPFGMFYSNVSGALIMLAVLFFGGFLAFGLFWFVLWPAAWVGSMVWGALAASRSSPRLVYPTWR